MHIALGVVIYIIPVLSKVIFIVAILFFLYRIFNATPGNKPLEIILACCYMVGAEVLFRMTSATFFYEGVKYLVILFMLIGLVTSHISNRAYPYFIYLILLAPSIVVAMLNLNYGSNLRTNITFVLSGPVCLGFSALYLFDKKIVIRDFLEAIKYLSLPIISMTTYLYLYNPSIRDVLSGTSSNFAASGGFGPNQVATVLGLGMFTLTVRLFMKSPTLWLKILNTILLIAVSYRGIITFSRGGILVALAMITVFLLLLYQKSTLKMKGNILFSFLLIIFLGPLIWLYTSSQTDGLIEKRYVNQDALGREKEDITTGRLYIFKSDLEGFFQHPILGVGANGAKELRIKNGEDVIASHNEISRLLSEHGSLAFIILLILGFMPLLYRVKNNKNIFFYAMLGFWFATINHSSMRIAAPGFIYALALLNVQNDKRPVYRKRLVKRG